MDVSESMTDAMPTLKAAVQRIPRRAASGRPGQPARLQRQHLHAGAALDRSPGASEGCRSSLPLGRHRAVRCDPYRLGIVGKQPGRRALVVFTDGEDRNSVSTIKRVETRLETSDATIYTIGLGRSVTNPALAASLEHIAATSGGRAFMVGTVTELDKVVQRDCRGVVAPISPVLRFVERSQGRLMENDSSRGRPTSACASVTVRATVRLGESGGSQTTTVATPCHRHVVRPPLPCARAAPRYART